MARRKFTDAFRSAWTTLTGRTPEVLNRSAGSKVAEIRKASGKSDAEIARDLGVKERTVKAWAAGKSEPRGETARNLDQVMTSDLAKREEQRRERSARRRGEEPRPARPAAFQSIEITGQVKTLDRGAGGRIRPRKTYTIKVRDGKVQADDIIRMRAAIESGDNRRIRMEAVRLIKIDWGIPLGSPEYQVSFVGTLEVE